MTSWQLTIDCADPTRMVRFWGPLLGYDVAPPPPGHPTWNSWYLSVGVPEDELDLEGDSVDRLVDPTGRGPTIWFQVVPEPKTTKNRLHLDLLVGGGSSGEYAARKAAVQATVAAVEASGGSVREVTDEPGQRYSVGVRDPEGNEFCLT